MISRSRAMNLIGLCLLLSPGARAFAQQVAGLGSSSTVLEQFPIHNDGDQILLPVKFHGEVYQFVLDTGAGMNVYDTSLRPHLGAPLKVVTAKMPRGTMKMSLFSAPAAMIGSLSLQTPGPVACADLDMIRRATGHDVRGIIGMAFLAEHVVELDFDQGRLAFLSSAPAQSGSPIPLFPLADLGLPAVYAEVEG